MRTILDYVRLELGTVRYKNWAADHQIDDGKVHLELGGNRRPNSHDSYAFVLITAIRAGLADQPPPPAPTLQELGRNVMFTAQNPLAALRCPKHWKIAVSGDPAFDAQVRDAAPKITQNGYQLAVWGDPAHAARIKKLAVEFDADLPPILQAENQGEYDAAMVAGATMLVGNPNGWTEQQRADAKLRGDKLATMFEVYANSGSPMPDVASSRGVPISCEVLGVGSWDNGPNLQLADYQAHTDPGTWANMSVYLAENMDTDSWSLLP